MNWVKENKFLTGFIVVLLIGVGALGYEIWSASSAYDDASDRYTKAAGDYNTLRHAVPFPNRQNLEAYEGQKDEAATKITAFESDLTKKEFPLEPISPEKFQDQLKASVSAVRAKAQENGINLPDKDKFYLGFEKYEAKSPPPEAAAPLARELKAIEWVVNQYLAHPATQMHDVAALVRMDLPEEKETKGAGSGGQAGSGGGSGARPGGGGPGGRGPGSGGGSGRRALVQYHPFDITVVCKQQALAEVLKAVTGAQAPQFYVLREIRIKNSNEKAPARATPDAAKPDEKQTVQYIVGEEWIDVAAHWEVVDFTSPSDKTATDQSGSSPKSRSGPKSTPAPAATLNPAAIAAPTVTLAPAATPASGAPPTTAATPAPQSTPAPPKP